MSRFQTADTIFTVAELMYELVSGIGPVRQMNLHCLADMNEAELTEVRNYWLLVSSRRRSQVAFGCLGLLRSSLALQFKAFFCHLLADPNSKVRELAVEGLGIDIYPDVLPRLESTVSQDESTSVRLAAVKVLGRFLEFDEGCSLGEQVQLRVREILIQLIYSAEHSVSLKCAALESLGFDPSKEFMSILDEAFRSDLEELRVSAMVAMGRSGSLHWEDLILEALDDQSGNVRAASVRAGGLLGLESLLDVSLNIIELDSDSQMRIAAIEALGHLGGPTAYEGLLLAAESEDLDQREAVLKALEEQEFDAAQDAI